jgi:formylmethanofuran dehydrogenase subunit A
LSFFSLLFVRALQAPAGAKVIDASGSYVMPGGIDPHTHLAMPFMGQVACDDFYRCGKGTRNISAVIMLHSHDALFQQLPM